MTYLGQASIGVALETSNLYQSIQELVVLLKIIEVHLSIVTDEEIKEHDTKEALS